MADAPPPGPPPPKVPEGWKAVWNSQYNEWFYVNKFTKVSQWDKPTEAAVDPNAHDNAAPAGAPPGYATMGGAGVPHDMPTSEKHNPNNPYNASGAPQNTDADARYAAQLQAEENARVANRPTSSSNRGASDAYYQTSPTNANYGQQQSYAQNPTSPTNYGQQSAAPSDGKRGFLSKILGKSSSSHPPQQGGYGGYGPGAYGQQAYPPQGQQYYGGGGYPQQGYYGGQPHYQQAPPRKSGGMGAGGALLGAGAGLVGGAMLMNAFDDHEQFEEQQAYEAGQQDGYDDASGGGGDDMGGGDF